MTNFFLAGRQRFLALLAGRNLITTPVFPTDDCSSQCRDRGVEPGWLIGLNIFNLEKMAIIRAACERCSNEVIGIVTERIMDVCRGPCDNPVGTHRDEESSGCIAPRR